MKAFSSSLILVMLVIMAVSADKRPRVTFFQRQTQSTKPALSPDNKPSGADSGPYPPSNSGPYQPSGWKPDGPQLEYGTPEKKPSPSDGNTTTESTSNSGSSSSSAAAAAAGNGDSPSKFVSLTQPESSVYYYVLDGGRLQPLVLAPVSAALVQQNVSPQRLVLTKSLKLQVREVEPVQGPIYAYTGPLVRVLRNA